jgi:hypothetical protein
MIERSEIIDWLRPADARAERGGGMIERSEIIDWLRPADARAERADRPHGGAERSEVAA